MNDLIITIGTTGIVFGVPKQTLPLRGFPPGKARLRFRQDHLGRCFIRTDQGIRCFSIRENEGSWEPLHEISANLTA